MDPFKEQVKRGFQACKADIQDLASSFSEEKTKISALEKENKELKEQLVSLHTLITDMQQQMNKKEVVQEPLYEQTKPAVQAVVEEPAVKDPYEALLAFKAKTNKREVVKQKMLTMVGEQGMQLAELKFMIVEHFRYCSKATFYNYLKELEIEKLIDIKRENTKNMVILTHLSNHI